MSKDSINMVKNMMDQPAPSSEGRRRSRKLSTNSADIPDFDTRETMELPALGIEQLPTQVGMPAIFVPTRFSMPVARNLSIADTPTWLLPVIPKNAVNQARRAEQGARSLSGTGARPADAQSYFTLALDMVKSAGVYALGAVVSPLVSLVLTPFLTHSLSSNDYGALALLYTVITCLQIVTQLGLGPAFFRAYNGDYESPRDRLGVLSASIILSLLVSLPVAVVMIVIAPLVSGALFANSSFKEPVQLAALTVIVANLAAPAVAWLRAEKRAVFFTVISIANLLFVLGASVVLVGLLHMGIEGALLANAAGSVFTVACVLPVILVRLIRGRGLRLRLDIVWSMLAFGAPLILGDIASWVLQLSDRYLLSHFGSLAQTASYSVAYTLGGVLSPVVLAPFGLAWVPLMYTIAKRKDAPAVFQFVFRWYSIVLLFATFALSLMSTLVFGLFFPPSYYGAAPVIPLIALSTLGIGLWYMLMTGVFLRRKTIFESISTVIAAVANVIINLFLIPRYGAIGAAASTLLAYVLLVTMSYIVNQRIYPIKYGMGSFLLRLCVGISLYVGANVLAEGQTPFITWSICLGALVFYGMFLLFHAGLSGRQVKKIFSYVRGVMVKKESKNYA